MKFKVDENLPAEAARLLREAGHDALLVLDQASPGTADSTISELVRTEGRVLLTLDRDFADIRAYKPSDFPGIIVLRPGRLSAPATIHLLRRVIIALIERSPDGELWIVDEERIRIR